MFNRKKREVSSLNFAVCSEIDREILALANDESRQVPPTELLRRAYVTSKGIDELREEGTVDCLPIHGLTRSWIDFKEIDQAVAERDHLFYEEPSNVYRIPMTEEVKDSLQFWAQVNDMTPEYLIFRAFSRFKYLDEVCKAELPPQ